MCTGMPCCPEHCCDWDDCQCGDCEQCGGLSVNLTLYKAIEKGRRMRDARGYLCEVAESDEVEEPQGRSFLSSKGFWETYYADGRRDAPVEFAASEASAGLVASHAQSLGPSAFILELGCGNSTLANALCERGYRNVLSVDFSSSALQRQAAARASRAVPSLAQMDVCALAVRSASVDLAFDKATLDAVLCDPVHGATDARRMCCEVSRALRPGGVYLHLSDAPYDKRLRVLEDDAFSWRVDSRPLRPASEASTPQEIVERIYVCTKEVSVR